MKLRFLLLARLCTASIFIVPLGFGSPNDSVLQGDLSNKVQPPLAPLTPEAFKGAVNNTQENQDFLKSTVKLIDGERFFCSGTIISDDGLVVTAAHCLRSIESPTIKVRVYKTKEQLEQGERQDFMASVVTSFGGKVHPGFDQASCDAFKFDYTLESLWERHDKCAAARGADFAVLEIIDQGTDSLSRAELCTGGLAVGETVYSFNYPWGILQTSKGQVYPGRTHLLMGGHGFITSAFVGPGSSGGSLFNEQGQLCGLTNSQALNEEDYLAAIKEAAGIEDLERLLAYTHELSESLRVDFPPPIAGAITSIPYLFKQYQLSCMDKKECFASYELD